MAVKKLTTIFSSSQSDNRKKKSVMRKSPLAFLLDSGECVLAVGAICAMWRHHPRLVVAQVDGGIRRNPNKTSGLGGTGRANQKVEFILCCLATTLLLAQNIFLAFIYWNRWVDPSSFTKIYRNVVVEGEIWRAFTGTTVHFKPLPAAFGFQHDESAQPWSQGWGDIAASSRHHS